MSKIFIVTSGSYSDYAIWEVFKNKDNAKKYIDFNGIKEAEIEEFEIYDDDNFDVVYKNREREVHYIRINKEGKIIYWLMEKNNLDAIKNALNKREEINLWDELCLYIFARDKKHAIKIANEKRVKHIANNTWIKK